MAATAFARKTALADRLLAAAFAAVQADVFIRLREIGERRSDLAQSHRAYVSLLDATAADVGGVVRRSIAGVVLEIILRGHVCD